MKILFVNSVYGVRSTGKLIARHCHELLQQGHTCVVAYGREAVTDNSVQLIHIGSKFDQELHALNARIMDNQGLVSRNATRKFLATIRNEHFDLIWLHNIHGYYLNYELLFQWLKAHPEIRVHWTLHDCWAFTGHCAYFTMAKCDKWKTGCNHCIQKNTYPKSIFLDGSQRNYDRKRRAFTGVSDMRLFTPSQWLADLTRESFLHGYQVELVKNEIDRDVFCPTEGNFRSNLGINDRFMVLGVAVGWEETKGLQDIISLYERLDERFVIVLVGDLTGKIRTLPPGIIHIPHTRDQKELAEIYTAADVLVNPTHQDNYPTVNLEAAACGTPVITYRVGGSPESVSPENVVEEYDLDSLVRRIEEICNVWRTETE